MVWLFVRASRILKRALVTEFHMGIRTSSFVVLFFHDFGQQNKSFPFFLFRFRKKLINEILSSIFVFRFCVFVTSGFYLNRKNEAVEAILDV